MGRNVACSVATPLREHAGALRDGAVKPSANLCQMICGAAERIGKPPQAST